MMPAIRTSALVLVSTIAVFYFTACTSNRISQIKPYSFQVAHPEWKALGQIYEHPFELDLIKKGPKPMPGRLLAGGGAIEGAAESHDVFALLVADAGRTIDRALARHYREAPVNAIWISSPRARSAILRLTSSASKSASTS